MQVYRSTDVGAPTLSGTAGSLINLLNACLVTGYGSKAGAGWTMPDLRTNIGTFLPASNSAYFVITDDGSSSTTLTTGYASVRMTSSLANAISMSGLYPSSNGGLYTYNCIYKYATASSNTSNWRVFANSNSCYIYVDSVMNGSTNGGFMTFFGDYTPFNQSYSTNAAMILGITENAILATANGTSYQGFMYDNGITNGTSVGYLRNDNGGYARMGLFFPYGVPSALGMNRNQALPLLPLYVRTTQAPTTVDGGILGVMPGLYTSPIIPASNNTQISFSNGELIGKTFDVCIHAMNSTTYYGHLIETTPSGW